MFPRLSSFFFSWRTIFILFSAVVVLQFIGYIFTWRAHHRLNNLYSYETASISTHSKQQFYLGKKVSEEHEAILSRLAQWSVLDGSGKYRVAPGIILSENQNRKHSPADVEIDKDESWEVTLVSHCSLSKLYLAPALVRSWKGPVSLVVFSLSGEVQAAVQTILQMRRCYYDVLANCTFSLVFPLSSHASPRVAPTSDFVLCSHIYPSINHTNYDFQDIQYPNNLLRNVARKMVDTKFMFMIDIDMQPCINMHQLFLSYAYLNKPIFESSKELKTVWVVPSYEIKASLAVPQNKEELLKEKKAGNIRPFYVELCWKCQKYTDYTSWEGAVSNGVTSLYEVLWKDPWEPFYISDSFIPEYSEQFSQYGFNRISQVCELHIAGYNFIVLDNLFLVHIGFKVQNDFHANKDTEQERNRILFRHFKEELKAKYPSSSRRCY